MFNSIFTEIPALFTDSLSNTLLRVGFIAITFIIVIFIFMLVLKGRKK